MKPGRAIAVMAACAGLALALPAVAGATITCAYDEDAPAGPLANDLFIATSEIEELVAVRRAGDGIAVTNDRTGQPVACAGPPATVTNIDTVVFDAGAPGAGLFISLRGGRFAPGADPEGDGSSEIEFDAGFSGSGSLAVGGSAGSDSIAFGRQGSFQVANLNGREASHDADVRFNGSFVSILARAYGGNDVVNAGGGAGIGSIKESSLTLYGGAGRDILSGGAFGDIIAGRGAKDVLRGNGGGDEIAGGRGRDTFKGGAGDDDLLARDGLRERVQCDSGNDTGRADRRDILRRCERVARD